MKVSVTNLENGGAVLVISGPGTKDILDAAEQLGINPQDYVIEALRHELKLCQLAREPEDEPDWAGARHHPELGQPEPDIKLMEEGYKAKQSVADAEALATAKANDEPWLNKEVDNGNA